MSMHNHKPNRILQVFVLGVCVWLYHNMQPAILAEAHWLKIFLLFVIAALGLSLTSYCLMKAAHFFEWLASHQVLNEQSNLRWGTYKDIKKEIAKTSESPFWGITVERRQKNLFINFESNAMTIAPAGSGKGVYTVVPMGMAIHESKISIDFKGEQICILKNPLEARGEIVHSLNPHNLWPDILGKSESLNPLDLIIHDLNTPDGLRDVPDDLRELTALILPEPKAGKSDDSYWREGSRRIIADVILLEAMVEGYDATLASVALLIEDRKALEHNLRWIVGVDLDGEPLEKGAMPIEQSPWAHFHSEIDLSEFAALVRARASNLLAMMCQSESKSFDSFISGAQQALAVYAFGRLAPVMGRSSFNIEDIKTDGKIHNIFIVVDNSRMETDKHFIEIVQWLIMKMIKRHANKKKPVYFILDEATNYTIFDLINLLTWARGYGVRLFIIFQALAAFEKKYGKEAVDVLLSETEIKQVLPGQRCPRTLELISQKILGQQTKMQAAVSLQYSEAAAQENMSETKSDLYSPDQIRRSPYGILIVRQALPMLFEPVAYAAIKPWRKQVDINPFHGKPFLQPVKVRL